MEILKTNIDSHFITEKSYSPIIKGQSTINHLTNSNRCLPRIIASSLMLAPFDEQGSYSSRQGLKISTLALLREYPSLTISLVNNTPSDKSHKRIEIKKRSYSKTPVEEYYGKIFNYTKTIFKSKQEQIDNRLNIYGVDNEDQYKKHILKLNLKKQKEGKPIREETKIVKEINDQVKGIKKKICFLKGVVDYAYPKAVIQKNRIRSKSKPFNPDSCLEEANRKISISPDVKIRKSKTNGGACYTMSDKDDQLRSDRELLDTFLLQTIDVKKC